MVKGEQELRQAITLTEDHNPFIVMEVVLVKRMLEELDRLRRGDLTNQEFNTLCHNSHEKGTPCSREQFAQNCVEFQNRLYGDTGESSNAGTRTGHREGSEGEFGQRGHHVPQLGREEAVGADRQPTAQDQGSSSPARRDDGGTQ